MPVVDASVALRVVTEGPHSDRARVLWSHWDEASERLVAPPIFWPEVTNAIWRPVYLGRMSLDLGERAFQAARDLGVQIVDHEELYPRTWQILNESNLPTAYDCCYLALAQLLGLDLWTADERLHHSVRGKFSWVKSLVTDAPS